MKEQIFALVDVNNCYVSCERVFNPKLNNRPVIVLSNNDGCAVARSQQAKDLGIRMGVPLFQIKDIVERNDVIVMSSNYAMYEEMSKRFYNILSGFVENSEIERYSIDEVFLNLTSFQHFIDLERYGHEMKNTLWQWLGLPVCVGIGRSKTEAKIANHIAKKNQQFNGVCDLVRMDPCNKEDYLSKLDVSEVWGVGRQHTKKLNSMGITSVLDLACSNPIQMKKLFSIVMARTVSELQGISCIEIENTPPSKKQIISSRSFGQKVTVLQDLKEAIALHAQDACRRLRADKSLCGCLIVFAQSNPFDTNVPYYNKSVSFAFPEPTDCVTDFVKAATIMITHVYKTGIKFKKCGVIMTCIEPKASHTYDLLTDMQEIEEKECLMKAYEAIQTKFGKKKIGVGPCFMPNRTWSMTRDKLSNNPFTWSGLLRVN